MEKRKPTPVRLTTTADHTIQTANDSVSAKIEIHRLRTATRRPGPSQNALSSGSQWSMRCVATTVRSVGRQPAQGFFT